MPQTSVDQSQAVAFAGMQADLRKSEIDSFTVEEASDEIPFGVAVKAGSDNRGALLLDATSDVLAGLVLHSHEYEKGGPFLGDTGLKQYATFNLGKKGRAYVKIEENVSQGGAVRVRAVATGAEVPGAFRTTADGTDTVDVSAFCSWVKDGTAADGFALLDYDFTNAAEAVAD